MMSCRKTRTEALTFNPIKVLFLRFQHFNTGNQITHLSILSRFYFYTQSLSDLPEALILSILSRFYFYSRIITAVLNWYILSILSRFYFYGTCTAKFHSLFPTFNPIKVLFLRETRSRTVRARESLSILSRFYFYSSIHGKKHTRQTSFNPIKVLFLLNSLSSQSGTT